MGEMLLVCVVSVASAAIVLVVHQAWTRRAVRRLLGDVAGVAKRLAPPLPPGWPVRPDGTVVAEPDPKHPTTSCACAICTARRACAPLVTPRLVSAVHNHLAVVSSNMGSMSVNDIDYATPHGVGKLYVAVIDAKVFETVVKPAVEAAFGRGKS